MIPDSLFRKAARIGRGHERRARRMEIFGPVPELSCFRCDRELFDGDEMFEDDEGNPICYFCFEKYIMAAEAAHEGDR
jgi:hypothetical protein